MNECKYQALAPQECDVKENAYYKLDNNNLLRVIPISNYFKFVQRTNENPYGKASLCGIVLNNEIIGGIEKENINKLFTPIFNLVKQLHSQQKTFTVEEIEQLTQKLEKAREYLNAIVNGTHFTEDLSGHLIELAQQALKELE